MSNREDILNSVRRNRPGGVPLPASVSFAEPEGNRVRRFIDAVEGCGGQVFEVTPGQIAPTLAARYPGLTQIASAIPEEMAGNFALEAVTDPHALAGLDLFICRGALGVAENGAIWVAASSMVHRAAPFLTQHLALVLDSTALVADMHEAYARIQVEEEGFGVFIAGPSKTADIEQSLVIGAHGPRSLTVLLCSEGVTRASLL